MTIEYMSPLKLEGKSLKEDIDQLDFVVIFLIVHIPINFTVTLQSKNVNVPISLLSSQIGF